MEQARGAGTVVTEPARVQAALVDKELAGLWLRAAVGEIPGVSAPVGRVLLSNLLVYAASDAEAEEAGRVVAEIAAEHPARVVIADAQPGEPGRELMAEVSMLCSITERGRRLCGEEIRVHVHGLAAAALGTIMPILAPDLPVYLWTPGGLPHGDEILGQLVHASDHWIVDSRRFGSWVEELKLAISLGPRHEPPVALHDLAWAGLSQWREVTAQHFDSRPARDYLAGIRRVEITHAPIDRPEPPVEPVLMAAWLIRQLGWSSPEITRGRDRNWMIATAANGRDVVIWLKPFAEAELPVDGVEFESDLSGKRGIFRAYRSGTAGEITLESEAPDIPAIRRTVSVTPRSEGRELLQALDVPGRDLPYDRVLPVVEELMRQLEGGK